MREDRAVSKPRGFKRAPLAAAIALAVSAPVAFAAAPTAQQLPGNGVLENGATNVTATAGTISSGTQTITVTGNPVINWGVASGAKINTTQPGGFNIGSKAALHFAAGKTTAGATPAAAVLNVDVSGNPSQIMGHLNDTGSKSAVGIFVSNANGIIVGSSGVISSQSAVGLISSSKIDSSAFAPGTGAAGIVYDGTGNDVTVSKGASITGMTTILVAGGNSVNVDLSALNTGTASLIAGDTNAASGSLASTNSKATLTLSGSLPSTTPAVLGEVDSQGALVNNGTLTVPAAATFTVAGNLTNAGALTADFSATPVAGDITNNGTLDGNGDAFAATGNVTNNGKISGISGVSVTGGNLANAGTLTVGTSGPPAVFGAVSVTNGSVTNSGSMTGVASLTTASNASVTSGTDLSITNSGTISGDLGSSGGIDANSGGSGSTTTTASFTNTGILNANTTATGAASGDGLTVSADGAISLGGTLQAEGSALSSSNLLVGVNLSSTTGSVNISTPVFSEGVDSISAGSTTSSTGQVFFNDNYTNTDTGSSVTVNTKGGSGPYNLGVVQLNAGTTLEADGGLKIDTTKGTTPGSALFYGTVNAGKAPGPGFSFTGASLFTGTQASIMADSVALDYTGVVAGGVDQATGTQSSDPYQNGVVLMPATSGGAVDVSLTPVNAGNAAQYFNSGVTIGNNVNLLVQGKAQLTTNMPATGAASSASQVTSGGSVILDSSFVPSNLFFRSTGDMTLNETGLTNNFYWPGLTYLSTVESGKLAQVSSTASITLGAGVNNLSNVVPESSATGQGMYLMTSAAPSVPDNVLINTSSNAVFASSVTAQYLGQQNASTKQYLTASAPSGNVLTFSTPLPAANFTSLTPPSE